MLVVFYFCLFLGANGMVSFRIESGNRGEPFEINNQTGEVTRVKALDFEDISSYQITIVAFDGGNPPLSSVATLRVAVINIDESPPRFQLPCEVTLDEVDVTPPDLPLLQTCLLYTSPSPRDRQKSRMPSSA